jgi:protein TonB
VAAALAPTGAFHSRPVLVSVVLCHLLAAFALVQLLDRARPHVAPPITVTLLAEPAPALEEPDSPPQPLPQAAAPPPRVKQPPKVAEIPAPPPVVEPPPVVPPEPEVRPEPPPVRVETPPEPVQAAPPPAPVARIEPDAVRVPPPPEPVRAPPPPPAPVAAAPPPPAPVAQSAPITEPLYGADYLRNPKPVYPLMSRRMGEQGVVLLRVFVTADGDPRQVVLKEGSGYSRLDRAAQDVVQRWKFVPAKRGDQPVDAWVLVPIRFTLKG